MRGVSGECVEGGGGARRRGNPGGVRLHHPDRRRDCPDRLLKGVSVSFVSGRVITVEGEAEVGVVYARPLRPFGSDVVSDAPLRWTIGPNGYLTDGDTTTLEVPAGQYRLDFNLRAGWVRSQHINIPHGGTEENPINIAGLLGVEDNHPPRWTLTQSDVLAILTARDTTVEAEARVRLLVGQVHSIEEQVREVSALTDRAETAATTAANAEATTLTAVADAQAFASVAGEAETAASAHATTATTSADRAETAATTALTAATNADNHADRAEQAAHRAEQAEAGNITITYNGDGIYTIGGTP